MGKPSDIPERIKMRFSKLIHSALVLLWDIYKVCFFVCKEDIL